MPQKLTLVDLLVYCRRYTLRGLDDDAAASARDTLPVILGMLNLAADERVIQASCCC